MKKIIPIAILVFIWVTTSGCSTLAGAFVASLPKVGIGSPFAGDNLGLTPRGITILITNAKAVDGLVFIYGKEMGLIKPGTTASFEKHFEPLVNQRIEVPVVVFFADEERNLAVVAERKFSTYSSDNDPRTETWMINENDGSRLTPMEGAGAEITGPGVNRVRMPREFWNGTLAIQMVNDSNFEILLRVHKKGSTKEYPVYWTRGRFSYSVLRSGLAHENEQVIFLVVLKDPATNRVMGIHKIETRIPDYGVTAEQWVIRNSGVDRR